LIKILAVKRIYTVHFSEPTPLHDYIALNKTASISPIMWIFPAKWVQF